MSQAFRLIGLSKYKVEGPTEIVISLSNLSLVYMMNIILKFMNYLNCCRGQLNSMMDLHEQEHSSPRYLD